MYAVFLEVIRHAKDVESRTDRGSKSFELPSFRRPNVMGENLETPSSMRQLIGRQKPVWVDCKA